MKKLFITLAILIIVISLLQTYNLFPSANINKVLKSAEQKIQPTQNQQIVGKQVILDEESTITKVVEQVLPSVVTVGISTTANSRNSLQFDPTDPFTPFKSVPGASKKVEQNIGSGFVISSGGLIITNKHVVADTSASYQILTNDKKKYTVVKIYRDPLNDLSILKIDATNLKPLSLGDSTKLKLGQMAIAIGTPLGEFTNTVTVGIVSGLGRGITAGSPFEGYVEKLDNIIQTDAAINPGNSGGPLLNSKGQVIGINTAVAQNGQNIGFAIPSNVISELVDNFNKRGGSFDRPVIGVRYKMIDKQTAIMNDVVEGAYVIEVVLDSPADKAGIQAEDIITMINDKKVQGDDEQSLAKIILDKKIGDKVKLAIWRDKNTIEKTLTLEGSNQ